MYIKNLDECFMSVHERFRTVLETQRQAAMTKTPNIEFENSSVDFFLFMSGAGGVRGLLDLPLKTIILCSEFLSKAGLVFVFHVSL